MGCDSGNASGFGVRLDELPDDLLGQDIATKLVGTVDGPKNATILYGSRRCPSINRNIYPIRHRRGANTSVLPNKIDDAPASIALLHMVRRATLTSWRPKPAPI